MHEPDKIEGCDGAVIRVDFEGPMPATDPAETVILFVEVKSPYDCTPAEFGPGKIEFAITSVEACVVLNREPALELARLILKECDPDNAVGSEAEGAVSATPSLPESTPIRRAESSSESDPTP